MNGRKKWSHSEDLNPRPAAYKAAALPTELLWRMAVCSGLSTPKARGGTSAAEFWLRGLESNQPEPAYETGGLPIAFPAIVLESVRQPTPQPS